MRVAECWSDHRMVRARLRMNLSEWRARASTCSAQSQVKRPNMSQLSSVEVQSAFDDKLAELVFMHHMQYSRSGTYLKAVCRVQPRMRYLQAVRSQRTGSWRMKV